MIVGDLFFASTCPAIAAEARRTPGKVKSSAIIPRQPEVPKWIAWSVTPRYCIVSRKRGASGIHRRAKSKGSGAHDGQDRGFSNLRLAARGTERHAASC